MRAAVIVVRPMPSLRKNSTFLGALATGVVGVVGPVVDGGEPSESLPQPPMPEAATSVSTDAICIDFISFFIVRGEMFGSQ